MICHFPGCPAPATMTFGVEVPGGFVTRGACCEAHALGVEAAGKRAIEAHRAAERAEHERRERLFGRIP